MHLALTLVAVLIVTGAVFIIAGIQMLAGTPWALIAGGLFLLAAGFALRAGLVTNG